MLPIRSRESHSRVHSARIMMHAAYKQERDTCLLNLTAEVHIQLLDDCTYLEIHSGIYVGSRIFVITSQCS